MLVKLEFRSLLRKLPDAMKDKDNAPTMPALDTNDIEEIEPGTAQAVLIMAPELVVWADGDNVWLSHERTKAACLTRVDAEKILVHVPMIGHDVKMFLKQLLTDGITTLPKVQHDTAQGSFLLNPLRKSRRLEDLVGLESIDSPQSAVRAIWALYDEQRQAFEALPDLSRVAHEMDFPLIAILARMEHQGIRLDAGVLDTMNTKLTREIADIQAQVHDMVGYEFNVSSPMQLSEALFTKLQLPTVGIKKGRTGYSTGQKELDKLRGQHPIVELVERYRELAKLQNTYVTTLPQQADERGYVHTTFNQDVVATGRLSSTDPNLQNIPIRTALGRHIRDAFVPADGNMFVNADYSQFELRLAAVMAGEQSMIDDFNSDTDIHAKTAAEVYGVPLDDVTPAQRRRAKVVNFGVLYGMGQHGLAAAAHMSYAEAQHFIDEYYRMHPNLKAYMENTIQKAHDDGFVETLFGRRRWTPDVKSSNFAVRNAAERAAANMPIQGTEADLMKLAMIKVQQLLDRDYPKARQILQIHDSILVECPRTETKAIAALLVDAMEQVYPKLGIRLRVDVKIGAHWGDV